MTEITTAAELDALPVGSVVLREYSDGTASVYTCARRWYDDAKVWCPASDEDRFSASVMITGISDAPLTVLYRPDRPSDSALREAGASLIAAERKRQIEQEHYTVEHDVTNEQNGRLVSAAICYALQPWRRVTRGDGTPYEWPWAREFWKPTPDDRVRELVKAGALIAAEIDRLRALVSGAGA